MKPILQILFLCLLVQTTFSQTNLFWINPGTGIEASELDGSDRFVVIPIEEVAPQGMAIDALENKIYWTAWDTKQILRANLDGSDIEVVLEEESLDFPEGLAVDPFAQKIYWVDSGNFKIRRANYDGTGMEDLIILNEVNLDGIIVDPINERLYWAQYGQENGSSGPNYGKIRSAKLNGADTTTIINVYLGLMKGLALDSESGKLYWTDCGHAKIQRSNLDGSNIEDLIDLNLGSPNSMDLDLENGYMYWSDGGTFTVNRAKLDGSDQEIVVDDMNSPQAVLVLNCPEKSVDCFTNTTTTAQEVDLIKFEWAVINNPVSTYLQIEFSKPGGYLNIYDYSGQIVNTSRVESYQQDFYLGNLSNGMYVLEWITEGKRSPRKIIKQ